MNKLIYIALALGLAASASFVLPLFEGGVSMPFLGESSNQKCLAQDGSVYYGEIPKNVVCKETVLIDGALTIIESQANGIKNREKKGSRTKCDGRKRCSQMSSCSEAKYFLKNCPNTEMDGDGDGVPCERQWCG